MGTCYSVCYSNPLNDNIPNTMTNTSTLGKKRVSYIYRIRFQKLLKLYLSYMTKIISTMEYVENPTLDEINSMKLRDINVHFFKWIMDNPEKYSIVIESTTSFDTYIDGEEGKTTLYEKSSVPVRFELVLLRYRLENTRTLVILTHDIYNNLCWHKMKNVRRYMVKFIIPYKK